MTMEEFFARSVRWFLSGNYDGMHRDGYAVCKEFEVIVEKAVLQERLMDTSDAMDLIDEVWDQVIEPEFSAIRNMSNFVDEFLPSGTEYYVRDAVYECICEEANLS